MSPFSGGSRVGRKRHRDVRACLVAYIKRIENRQPTRCLSPGGGDMCVYLNIYNHYTMCFKSNIYNHRVRALLRPQIPGQYMQLSLGSTQINQVRITARTPKPQNPLGKKIPDIININEFLIFLLNFILFQKVLAGNLLFL